MSSDKILTRNFHPRLINFLSLSGLILLAIVAYHNSFQGVFLLDDFYIFENRNLHRLWPLSAVLLDTNRPLLNLSLAINYAIGRGHAQGYHLVNLFFHVLSGMALFGFLKEIFNSPLLQKRYARGASAAAFFISAIWLIHPLNTSSVTYIIQRAEVIMGCCYLMTLYFSVRYFATQRRGFAAAAILACSLGMMVKEVMITAPVMVFLTEKIFFRPPFKEMHGKYFLAALAFTWLIPVLIALNYHGQFETAGFALPHVTVADYARNQPQVILHYMKLAFWPSRLCLDYLWPVFPWGPRLYLSSLAIGCLLLLTAWALVRFPAWGYWGVWIFVLLSVTSSFVPLQDLAFEHRMYLPLIGIIVLTVLAARKLFFEKNLYPRRVLAGFLGLLIISLLTGQTIRRNQFYQSSIVIWKDTVQQRPQNYRAFNELGLALMNQGRWQEAEEALHKAMAIKPQYEKPVMNMGLLKARQKKFQEAKYFFERALQLIPGYAPAYFNLGVLNLEQRDYNEAVQNFETTIKRDSGFLGAYNNLGFIFLMQGRLEEAGEILNESAVLDPSQEDVYINLGLVNIKEGDWIEARRLFEKVLKQEPRNPVALANLFSIYSRLGQTEKAAQCRLRLEKYHKTELGF